MKIFDCHIHCSESKDDVLIDYARANHLEYTLSELLSLMEENGVEAGLLLSPPLRSRHPLANEKVIDLCEKSRGRLKPIITVEPEIFKVEKCLRLARQEKDEVRGFKILLGYFQTYASAKIYSKVYDFAEAQDLPVMFHTGDTALQDASLIHAHPLTLDELANRRANLKIVLCHFGNPWLHDAAELLYKHPNVYADISGLFLAGGKYSTSYFSSLASKISESIYYVGNADKIFFGTDYPIERYDDALRLVGKLKIEEDDLKKILYDNAKGVFDI